jgi:hypothetical protein
VGTSDSGAWTFAQAVRAARNAELPATILVVAGQIIPSGYVSQYQIRTVLGQDDQAHGLDMLAIGDLVMDVLRRNLRLQRDEIERLLSRVAARKLGAGAGYPAGIHAGRGYKRESRRTPYFDASDIAVPCCGAAATIVTSDEELALAIAASRSERFRTPPVTEVLGVGEGSSNENFLHRKSPLLFTTAVREAFADTADDARLPLSVFPCCAFGVAHDAFPSIELSFLLGMGLSWERSAERMAEGWSNPLGGLLTFGHALGASGLVQVNKAHHLFCVDQRYIAESPGHRREGFRRDGALAFTTSVGGPLSHVVAGIFRGGYQELRPLRDRVSRRAAGKEGAPAGTEWRARRYQLRLVLPSYLRGVDGAWLVEGTTYVSIRSCLKALTAEDVARLQFDGIEELVKPERLEELRVRLRTVVALVKQESERLSSMFDVFRVLTDEVRELAAGYVAGGLVPPEVAAQGEDRLADRLKECLRAPLMVLCAVQGDRARRQVRFLPQAGVSAAQLEEVDLISERTGLPLPAPAERLPFWNARAKRPEDTAPAAPAASAKELLDRIVAQPGGPRDARELSLLRAWFAPDAPRTAVQRALREAGCTGAGPEPRVRSVFYLGEMSDPASRLPPEEGHELLGRAAREARAFVEAYQSGLVQVGPTLALVAFERPPFVTRADEVLISTARFAQEVARAVQEHGLSVRAAACAGEGGLFDDVAGRPSVASPAAARAQWLLACIRQVAQGRSALVIEGGSSLLVPLLKQRLVGWELQPEGPAGATIWIGPSLDPS